MPHASLGSALLLLAIASSAAAAPIKLGFPNPPQLGSAGGCIGPVTVEAEDSSGGPSGVTAATTVNLTSTSATLAFHSSSGCASPVTSVTIPASGTTTSFYFKDTSTGSPAITASATGLTLTRQIETITAAPTRIAITNLSQNVGVNVCSGANWNNAITLQTLDAAGSPATVVSTTTLALASSSATTTFYTSSSCSTPVTSLTMAPGSRTASVYFKDTTQGSITITVSGLGTASITENIGPPPARLTLAQPQTVNTNTCTYSSVGTADANAASAQVATATAINLTSSSGTMTYYSDWQCTTPITQVTISAGSTGTSFYFKETSPGRPTLTASATGLTSATETQTIVGGTAAKLSFNSSPLVVATGACSAARYPSTVTVQVLDSSGAPTSVAANTVLSLTSSSPTMGFYTDSACNTPLTSLTLSAGGGAISFYLKDTVAETATLTVSTPGLTSASQRALFTSPPTRLAFAWQPVVTNRDGCTGVGLQTQSSTGTPVAPAANVTAALTSSSATTTFYSDDACTVATTTATLTNSYGSGTFYFKDSTAGRPVLTASSPGMTSASQTQTVASSTPSKLSFLQAPLTLTAGACSSVQWPYYAQLQALDSSGSPAVLATRTPLSLTSSSGTLRFYSDWSCTTPITSITLTPRSIAYIYVRDTVAGTPAITAAAAGLGSAVQTVSVLATPTRLSFDGPPQAVTAGTCLGATVSSRNAQLNQAAVSANTPVTLSSSSPTLTFYSDWSCTTPVTSLQLGSGSSQLSFRFKDTAAGTPTLTASAAGFTSASQAQTSTSLAPSRLGFQTRSAPVAAGGCSQQANVTLLDANGNVTKAATTVTVALTSSAATTTRFYADWQCTTQITSASIGAGGWTTSFYFSDTATGAPTLTASATGLTAATQPQVLTAGASSVVFQSVARSVAAGACSSSSSSTTLQALDASGSPSNPASPIMIALSSSSPTLAFYSDSSCTSAITTTTVSRGSNAANVYFKDSTPGSPTLTATASGGVTGTTSQAALISPGPTALAFNSSSGFVGSSACTWSQINMLDASGGPAAVATNTVVSLTSSSPTLGFYTNYNCTTPATSVTLSAGNTAVGFYFKDTTAGQITLSASATGLSSTSQPNTVLPAATQLAFSSSARSTPAGACSTSGYGAATITTLDASGSPAAVASDVTLNMTSTSGSTIFYSDYSCTTLGTSVVLSAGNRSTYVVFKDSTPGAPTVTVSSAGLGTTSQVQTISSPPSILTTSSAQTLNVGSCSSLYV